MYDKNQFQDASFIDDAEILGTLEQAKKLAADKGAVRELIAKARECHGLDHREAAVFLEITDPELEDELYSLAKEIKERIYGRRIVLFAPLYVSNYCVNGCTYCGFHKDNKMMFRKKLTMEEIDQETDAILALGHKRIAMESGEDPVNSPLDYIIECMERVYAYRNSRGDSIRRINVNIAATTVEEFKRLKAAQIGTYILFQETFHRPTYAKLHPCGPKSIYNWHTTALHRAQEGGIDDVGTGVLYGLYDYKYETVAQLMLAENLEKVCGVGPHTISVPRLREAEGVDIKTFPYIPTDEQFLRVIATLRVATPYTGMIISTRGDAPQRARPRHIAVQRRLLHRHRRLPQGNRPARQPRHRTVQNLRRPHARRSPHVALRGRLHPELLHRLLPPGTHRRPLHVAREIGPDTQHLPAERDTHLQGIPHRLRLRPSEGARREGHSEGSRADTERARPRTDERAPQEARRGRAGPLLLKTTTHQTIKLPSNADRPRRKAPACFVYAPRA